MGFLEDSAYWFVCDVLGLARGEHFSEALAYFIYDSVKIFFLLAFMVFLVSLLRTFITPQKVRQLLGGKKEGVGNVLAALLGVPTPFCSCSAVPLFIGFMESGVPLGVTFSFLVAAPTVNEVAVALLFGLFGWQVTALYIGAGLFIAVFSGIIIGRLNLEHEVADFVYNVRAKKVVEKKKNWSERFDFARCETISIANKIWLYLLLGIGIGAFIHGFVPMGFLSDIAGPNNPLAVPIAVIIGIPLYSNAAGTIPIVQALMSKGMAIGTALAFMMSVTALSLPEMVMLSRVLKPRLLAVFIAILSVAFALVGLLFNFIIK